MANIEDVPDTVRQLAAQLSEPRPMRRGSAAARDVKCSKPGCPCGQGAGGRHGPYYSLTRKVGGRTQSRLVSAEQFARLQQQIDAGRQFRRRVEAYWEACERWADAHLATDEAASQEAAKKGGSKRPSRPRSSGRLTRS